MKKRKKNEKNEKRKKKKRKKFKSKFQTQEGYFIRGKMVHPRYGLSTSKNLSHPKVSFSEAGDEKKSLPLITLL